MRILIIGSGGREHALAWKAARSSHAERVYVAPGNAGTALEDGVENVAIAAHDIDALVAFARDREIALTIVGPEGPLVAGVVDAFAAAGLACFGPHHDAARLEGSKAYMKDFLRRHRIPTAAYQTFTRSTFDRSWVLAQRAPLVVKADGLAAGKGVIICASCEDAARTAQAMFAGQFGQAGDTVVIEEFLEGEEASFIAMIDGRHVLPLASSQDHKRRDDGDCGPNTGGMGAYSPAPVVTAPVHDRIMREVMEPTVQGLASEGSPYVGFLYAGLMVAPDGRVSVLEFNCRLGDPETQPIMMRLESDLIELCVAGVEGRLDRHEARWDPRAALGVVIAAGEYPEGSSRGAPIGGLSEAARRPGKVFHAGTRLEHDTVVTDGGRVLCAVGLGDTVAAASAAAYSLAAPIHWDGMRYRRDIGWRAIERECDTG